MKNLKKSLAAFLAVMMIVCSIPSGSVFAAKKLAAPAPSAYTSGSNITVKWGKVKNATGYRVYYTTDSKFKKGVKSYTTTKTSTTITKLSHYKKYYIRVKSCKGKKKSPNSSYSKKVSAVTDVPASYIKSLSGYEDAINVYTSTASKCFYQISYSTDKAGKKNVKYKTTSSTSTTIPVHDGNGKATTYYVWVRSQRKNGSKTISSSWSSVKSVTTKAVNYPKQPWITSSSTALSDSTASLTVDFNNYGGNITAYQVDVSTNNTFKTIAATAKASGKSVQVNNLKQDTVYYYRVRGVRNVQGKEYYGSWYTPNDSGFVTGNTYAQNAPVVTLSLSNQNKTVNASWTMSGNTYSSVSYIIQCSTDSSFTDNSKITKEITQTGTTALFDAEYYNTYYVRTKAVLAYNSKTYTTPWSAVKSVTSKNPYEITDSVKISSVTATKTSVTVQWDSIANATGYEVQLAANKDFANNTTQTTSALNVTFNDLMDGTTYYVRIRAFNNASEKTYYSPWTTQSVTTKSDVINEGVTYQIGYASNIIIPSKPCLISQKESEVWGFNFSSYYKMLKSAYAEMNIFSATNDIEKFQLIHTWVGSNIQYDERSTKGEKIYYHTSYDALAYGKSVCSGYSSLVTDFCYLANIPCYKVASTSSNHAWVIVQLQGKWYAVEVTDNGYISQYEQNPYDETFIECYNESDLNVYRQTGIGMYKYNILDKEYQDMIKNKKLDCGSDSDIQKLKPLYLKALQTTHDANITIRIKERYDNFVNANYGGKATYRTPGKDIYIY